MNALKENWFTNAWIQNVATISLAHINVIAQKYVSPAPSLHCTGCPKNGVPFMWLLWRSRRFNYLGFYTFAFVKLQLRLRDVARVNPTRSC